MKIDTLKSDAKNLTQEELAAKCVALQQELFSLRINRTTSHIKDYSQFKKIRKNIARLLTYLRQKNA